MVNRGETVRNCRRPRTFTPSIVSFIVSVPIPSAMVPAHALNSGGLSPRLGGGSLVETSLAQMASQSGFPAGTEHMRVAKAPGTPLGLRNRTGPEDGPMMQLALVAS